MVHSAWASGDVAALKILRISCCGLFLDFLCCGLVSVLTSSGGENLMTLRVKGGEGCVSGDDAEVIAGA